jgi:hypothetical protein
MWRESALAIFPESKKNMVQVEILYDKASYYDR